MKLQKILFLGAFFIFTLEGMQPEARKVMVNSVFNNSKKQMYIVTSSNASILTKPNERVDRKGQNWAPLGSTWFYLSVGEHPQNDMYFFAIENSEILVRNAAHQIVNRLRIPVDNQVNIIVDDTGIRLTPITQGGAAPKPAEKKEVKVTFVQNKSSNEINISLYNGAYRQTAIKPNEDKDISFLSKIITPEDSVKFAIREKNYSIALNPRTNDIVLRDYEGLILRQLPFTNQIRIIFAFNRVTIEPAGSASEAERQNRAREEAQANLEAEAEKARRAAERQRAEAEYQRQAEQARAQAQTKMSPQQEAIDEQKKITDERPRFAGDQVYRVYSKLGIPVNSTRYKILGVDPQASPENIRSAYRKFALKWHPDKNADPDATAVFNLVTWAYESLTK